jgi:O-antigen/teichoic acid export membrane protein
MLANKPTAQASRRAKVIALSVGQIAAKLVAVATLMLMVRVLSKEHLAAYQQTLLAFATASPLLSMGIGQGMYYFLPNEKQRLGGRISDGIFLLACAGLLFAIFIACGGNYLLARKFSNPLVANLLPWMIPYAIFCLPAGVGESVFVATNRVRLASLLTPASKLIVGLATVLPLLLWTDPTAPLIGHVFASVLVAAITLALIFNIHEPGNLYPTTKGIKELLAFSFPLSVAGMMGALSIQLDRLIVGTLCTPEEFAVYSVGAFEIPLIGIVTGAMTSVALADMRRQISDNKHAEALKLFKEIAKTSSYILFPAMAYLLIEASSIIELLFTSQYKGSATPFRIYATLLPIRTVVFGSILLASGNSRFILYRQTIGLIINVALSIGCVKLLGPWGAAASTVLTVYLWSVPANVFVISKAFSKPIVDVLPLASMLRAATELTPIIVASCIAKAVMTDTLTELLTSTVLFATYMPFYLRNHVLFKTSITPILQRLTTFLHNSSKKQPK